MDVEPQSRWVPAFAGMAARSAPRAPHSTSLSRSRGRESSEHVPLDPEMRQDLARDLLDGGGGRVERRQVFAAKELVGQRQFALALLEGGVLAARPPDRKSVV